MDREKVAQFMLRNSFATGHGDTVDELLQELEWQIEQLRGSREAWKQSSERAQAEIERLRERLGYNNGRRE